MEMAAVGAGGAAISKDGNRTGNGGETGKSGEDDRISVEEVNEFVLWIIGGDGTWKGGEK